MTIYCGCFDFWLIEKDLETNDNFAKLYLLFKSFSRLRHLSYLNSSPFKIKTL